MSTALVEFSEEDVKTVKNAILKGEGTDSDLKLFLGQCKRTGLDPLTRQIYGMFKKNKDGTKTMTVMTSIDGLRVVAERSDKYAGQVGPYWCGPDGVWKDIWLDKMPPAAAKVGVLRKDFKEPLWATALFEAYKQTTYDGRLSGFWAKGPEHMLAKCAESLALRKAFPNDLSGIYTREEMGSTIEAEVVEHKPHAEPPAPQQQHPILNIPTSFTDMPFDPNDKAMCFELAKAMKQHPRLTKDDMPQIAKAMIGIKLKDLVAAIGDYLQEMDAALAQLDRPPTVEDIYGPRGKSAD